MQQVVRDGMEGGALGLSVSRNKGHYDPQGVHIPALWADEKEIFALADVLRELGTGIIQSGGGRDAEMKDGLMARLSEATGRVRSSTTISARACAVPATGRSTWRGSTRPRRRASAPTRCARRTDDADLQDGNTQVFRGSPTWHPILLASDDEKLRAYADPAVRQKLHEEMVEWKVEIPGNTIARDWYNYIWVEEPAARKEQVDEGQDPRTRSPRRRTSGIIDAFLDLVVEEKLDTDFMQAENNIDDEAMRADPELPERADRPVGRRRACAVPRRLRLLDAPPRRMGAREAGHDPRKRGAPADLRLGLDLRPL